MIDGKFTATIKLGGESVNSRLALAFELREIAQHIQDTTTVGGKVTAKDGTVLREFHIDYKHGLFESFD